MRLRGWTTRPPSAPESTDLAREREQAQKKIKAQFGIMSSTWAYALGAGDGNRTRAVRLGSLYCGWSLSWGEADLRGSGTGGCGSPRVPLDHLSGGHATGTRGTRERLRLRRPGARWAGGMKPRTVDRRQSCAEISHRQVIVRVTALRGILLEVQAVTGWRYVDHTKGLWRVGVRLRFALTVRGVHREPPRKFRKFRACLTEAVLQSPVWSTSVTGLARLERRYAPGRCSYETHGTGFSIRRNLVERCCAVLIPPSFVYSWTPCFMPYPRGTHVYSERGSVTSTPSGRRL
ncbi:hypothetical protein FHS44_000786 [Streptosporangium saharense]|uniref:Uncharacterized protein n=1 Tax=Streptosporangium saharense TaxID=1706840 RepID=A0A7W7QHW8_9ACTN|nr:hypothetical protein [Streptosporangium saharense]